MYKLHEIIPLMKEQQLALATFADDQWYIIKHCGAICYFYTTCTPTIGELVPLTYSNINAYYTLDVSPRTS